MAQTGLALTVSIEAVIEATYEVLTLEESRCIPSDLQCEIDAMARDETADFVSVEFVGDCIDAVPAPRLMALLANLRACAVKERR